MPGVAHFFTFHIRLLSLLALSRPPLREQVPLERGAGIEQPMLQALGRHLEAGKWVHIFPEGRTQQYPEARISGRLPPQRARELGRLKWGTAKLVVKATAPGQPRPIVLPMYHRGMQELFPYRRDGSNKLQSPLPRTNRTVRLLVGKPLDLAPLIAKHRARRIAARPELQGGQPHGQAPDVRVVDAALADWKDTDADRLLYTEMMLLVERRLMQLEQQMDALEAADAHPAA